MDNLDLAFVEAEESLGELADHKEGVDQSLDATAEEEAAEGDGEGEGEGEGEGDEDDETHTQRERERERALRMHTVKERN